MIQSTTHDIIPANHEYVEFLENKLDKFNRIIENPIDPM
jgi:hypothetical protein